MRRVVLSLVIPALLVVGCGDGDTSVGTGTTPTVDPDTPIESPPVDDGPGDDAGDPTRVEPDPGAVGVRPYAFDSAVPVDDGPALLVRYWAGVAPCSVLGAVEVEETDQRVVVTLMVGSATNTGDVACIEIAQLYETQVALDRPLGDREIVDGAK